MAGWEAVGWTAAANHAIPQQQNMGTTTMAARTAKIVRQTTGFSLAASVLVLWHAGHLAEMYLPRGYQV